MWPLLRSTVSSPRKPFYDKKTGKKLDLAYITPRIIVSSMPAADFVRRKYRTPAIDIRDFLDFRHQDHWRIWNFRAEKSGEYKDEVFYGRVMHFPFPDHEAPPFHMIPHVVQSIERFLKADPQNVALLHCKAGQGRSGTMVCAYMIAAMDLTWQEAIDQFTSHRMRYGFGAGVSIKSQKRYLLYTEKWVKKLNRQYSSLDKSVVIEKIVIGNPRYDDILVRCSDYSSHDSTIRLQHTYTTGDQSMEFVNDTKYSLLSRSKKLIPYNMNPDIMMSFTRAKSLAGGLHVVHSVAHFWFNAIFETLESANVDDLTKLPDTPTRGFVRLTWEQLDGIIGTNTRGTQIFDTIDIVWKLCAEGESETKSAKSKTEKKAANAPEEQTADSTNTEQQMAEIRADNQVAISNNGPETNLRNEAADSLREMEIETDSQKTLTLPL